MSHIDDLIAEYERKIKEAMAQPQQRRWNSTDEMMRYLNKKRQEEDARPKPKPSLKEIDEELDITRGVKPTPDGYTVKPERIKELMKQRKELAA
jgi:hypothetical protein